MTGPLDDVDRRIIDQLQEEGRRPYTEIARAVGISEASVRQRVASLTERGVIQIVAATSPIALGMIQAFVSVRISGGGLERRRADRSDPRGRLRRRLHRAHRPARRRGVPRQPAPARGDGAIREIDGVAETDTAVILSELKDSYRFSDAVRATDADGAGRRGPARRSCGRWLR